MAWRWPIYLWVNAAFPKWSWGAVNCVAKLPITPPILPGPPTQQDYLKIVSETPPESVNPNDLPAKVRRNDSARRTAGSQVRENTAELDLLRTCPKTRPRSNTAANTRATISARGTPMAR